MLYTYPSKVDSLKAFLECYQMSARIVPPDEARRQFLPRNQRVCRFCEKDATQTTFRKEAHIIPQSLGNKYLLSDYECDRCNELFATYETNLNEYLGLYRTVFNIPGQKNKVPSYKTPGKNLVASPKSDLGVEKAITISDNSGTSFEINDDTGETIISYTKNNFVPIFAYKAFLKVALALIEEKDIPIYKIAFKFLMTNELDEEYGTVARVFQFFTSDHTFKTHCYFFEKIDPESRLPTHVFQLYFQNFVFQIFVPLNPNDAKMYDNKPVSMPVCPPIFYAPVIETRESNWEVKDWTGRDKFREKGYLKMNIDPEMLKEVSAMNPLTGQKIENYLFDSSSITKMVIVPANTTLPFTNAQENESTDCDLS